MSEGGFFAGAAPGEKFTLVRVVSGTSQVRRILLLLLLLMLLVVVVVVVVVMVVVVVVVVVTLWVVHPLIDRRMDRSMDPPSSAPFFHPSIVRPVCSLPFPHPPTQPNPHPPIPQNTHTNQVVSGIRYDLIIAVKRSNKPGAMEYYRIDVVSQPWVDPPHRLLAARPLTPQEAAEVEAGGFKKGGAGGGGSKWRQRGLLAAAGDAIRRAAARLR